MTAAVVVLLAAGCGVADQVGRTVDDGSRPFGSVDDAAATSLEAGDADGARPLEPIGLSIPRDCPVPWAPVYAGTEVTYPVFVPASGVRPERGESLDVLGRRFDPPDTDGDGTADLVGDTAVSGPTVVVTRADGDLVLASDQGVIGTLGGQILIGDLDGDGRDELMVLSSAGWSADGGYPLYVVPGSTPTGRHDPAVVGVRLPSGTPVMPAGDQDADGTDDVIMSAGSAARVVGGAAIMAPGPGGVLDGVPPALPGTPSGWFIGVVQLSQDQPPVLVLVVDGTDGAAALELWTKPRVVMGTQGALLSLSDALAMPPLTAYRSGSHRIIELASPVDRSGATTVWAWNLDDPCASPTPAG